MTTRPKNPFLRGSTLPEPFLAIGHRGARAFAPENTLVSFSRAIELGVKMIEFDVHVSKDGVPVVFHDHRLKRCTDAVVRFPGREPWLLADFTWAELRTLDAGSWFVLDPPFRKMATRGERKLYLGPDSMQRFGGGKVGIPSLEETLVLLEAHDVYANIELKAIPFFDPFLGTEVLRLVRRLGFEHRVVFSSFDHDLVREMKRAEPGIACGVLSRDRLAAPVEYLVDLVGADTFHPGGRPLYDTLGLLHHRTYGTDIHTERIRKLRAAGLAVLVWTIDHPEDIRWLKEAGVHGIMSDFPNRLSEAWLGQHAHEVETRQTE